jgi:DNA-directed RNA polymerase specialized sigma24 family protein
MSFKEIAELLKCPLNTALGRMHCAIKKLKEKLVKELEV